MTHLTLLVASWALITAKVTNSRLVVLGPTWGVVPTAFLISIAEACVVCLGLVDLRFAAVPALGAGGALGALTGIYLHKRVFSCPAAGSKV